MILLLLSCAALLASIETPYDGMSGGCKSGGWKVTCPDQIRYAVIDCRMDADRWDLRIIERAFGTLEAFGTWRSDNDAVDCTVTRGNP